MCSTSDVIVECFENGIEDKGSNSHLVCPGRFQDARVGAALLGRCSSSNFETDQAVSRCGGLRVQLCSGGVDTGLTPSVIHLSVSDTSAVQPTQGNSVVAVVHNVNDPVREVLDGVVALSKAQARLPIDNENSDSQLNTVQSSEQVVIYDDSDEWQTDDELSDGQTSTCCNVVTGTESQPAVTDDLMTKELQSQRLDPDISPVLQLIQQRKSMPKFNKISHWGGTTKALWSQWEQLKITNGLLCKRFEYLDGRPSIKQVIIPQSCKEEVVMLFHTGATGGHQAEREQLSNCKGPCINQDGQLI